MITVGIDEVGRGCWAGPLVAGAVVLHRPITGLKDSKKLTKLQRDRLALQIMEQAVAASVGWVWPEDIDRHGISISVKMAMAAALAQIKVPYDEVVIDGNINYLGDYPKTRQLIKADDLVPSASAASILAKVARDRYMATVAAAEYPEYGYEKHVGYGTALHSAMLGKHGVTPLHRKSYKPIQQLVLKSNA
ncbi:MAG TPA: ribonuclease HII [Candidatus Saccharimonadales bacterium]|nr:ribonuclease HII [Candidatus Saccharimonadales bacterium]